MRQPQNFAYAFAALAAFERRAAQYFFIRSDTALRSAALQARLVAPAFADAVVFAERRRTRPPLRSGKVP